MKAIRFGNDVIWLSDWTYDTDRLSSKEWYAPLQYTDIPSLPFMTLEAMKWCAAILKANTVKPVMIDGEAFYRLNFVDGFPPVPQPE